MDIYRWFMVGLISVILGVLAACGAAPNTPPPPTPTPTLPSELTFYAWPGYLPETIMTAFKQKYHIQINYQIYGSEDECLSALQAGKVFDVVVIDSRYVPTLIKAKQLAQINYRNIPNFKNISPNFRNLAHDPENKYTVPYHWGITGIIYRSDLIAAPTSWRTLADPQYKGKVGIWNIPSTMIGVALKGLGYSVDSNVVAENEEAGKLLLDFKRNSWMIDGDSASSTPDLINGKIVMSVGWSVDIIEARRLNNHDIQFALPEEGTLVWGDNLTIPANASNPYAAELFIDFLMQPEINAQLVNENGYATANDAAHPFIKAELLNNPLLYPETKNLKNAELIVLPTDPKIVQLQGEIWQQFLNTPPATE